jgi:predicted metalloprotease
MPKESITPNLPPRDRSFLVNTDAGWTVAHYSKVGDQFVYANLQADLFKGEWNDYYYDTEYLDESEIKEWKEL